MNEDAQDRYVRDGILYVVRTWTSANTSDLGFDMYPEPRLADEDFEEWERELGQ